MLQAACLLGQLFEFLIGSLKLYYFSDRKLIFFLYMKLRKIYHFLIDWIRPFYQGRQKPTKEFKSVQ